MVHKVINNLATLFLFVMVLTTPLVGGSGANDSTIMGECVGTVCDGTGG